MKPFVKAEMFTIWWKYIYYGCQNRNVYLMLFSFSLVKVFGEFVGFFGGDFVWVFFLL